MLAVRDEWSDQTVVAQVLEVLEAEILGLVHEVLAEVGFLHVLCVEAEFAPSELLELAGLERVDEIDGFLLVNIA